MKYIITIVFSTILLSATMAFNGNVTFKNGDNSTFSGKLIGDPLFHYVKTASGDVAIFNKSSGNFEYANFDNSGSNPKLVPSSVKVGDAGVHDNITDTQLNAVLQAAHSANAPLTSALLKGLIKCKTWYRVFRDVDGKLIYKVNVNCTATAYKEQQILPTVGSAKNHNFYTDGNKILPDGGDFYYYRVQETPYYLEVKEYDITPNADVLKRVSRWYSNQQLAQNYYNGL